MDKILSLSSIRRRRAALAEELSAHELRVSRISEDIRELDEAEAYVLRFGDEDDGDVNPDSQPQEKLPFPSTAMAKTTKDALLLALKVATEPWLTASELQVRASGLKGANIPMATVSPTLSNLKNAGLIVREGHKVALAARVRAMQQANREVNDELIIAAARGRDAQD